MLVEFLKNSHFFGRSVLELFLGLGNSNSGEMGLKVFPDRSQKGILQFAKVMVIVTLRWSHPKEKNNENRSLLKECIFSVFKDILMQFIGTLDMT